jgi:hypothetical protein
MKEYATLIEPPQFDWSEAKLSCGPRAAYLAVYNLAGPMLLYNFVGQLGFTTTRLPLKE